MKMVYRVLAYIIAAEVVVQAMAMVWGVAGELKWIEEGGVLDRSAMESEAIQFPEVAGFIIHGINGQMVIPLLALLLVISSFFARIPGASKWAGLVLLLVVVQVLLGMFGPAFPPLGALHGLNALLLFTTALYTARRARIPGEAAATAPDARVEARA